VERALLEHEDVEPRVAEVRAAVAAGARADDDRVRAELVVAVERRPGDDVGYAIRCSGGTRRSTGVATEDLRAPADERVGAPGPVDVERREDVGMLVEREEDEHAEAHEERRAQAARVLEAREVRAGFVPRHRREAGPAPREERRAELDEPEPEREPEAQGPRQGVKEALDAHEDVVVDRLVEAVPAGSDGGDRRAQDAGLPWDIGRAP
jgi:hypothetical protein